MARWLSFFAEYNFVVHYKPGKNNILADALSRRPDYDPRRLTRHQDIPDDDDDDDDRATCVTLGINATVSSPVLPLRQQIADAYEEDAFYSAIIRYLRNPAADTLAKLTRPTRDAITRYDLDGDLLTYAIDTFDTPRVVIPADDDLRARLVHEYHDAPAGGHLGREKTFAALSRDFFWPRMYKWIRKWVRSCEICQRVKPAASKQAPLRPLPIATSAWRSVSMDFVFGLPRDVDRFSKMVHLAPVAAEVWLTSRPSCSSTWCSATTACRSPSSRIVTPVSHPRSGRGCLRCWAPACLCPRWPIQRRMGKRSV
uniref:Integrase zinc-binding domain-containing protein n=1 Tax=Phytophthora fragariae TaxID=53985 RepID=A0A6A3E216_9STRA|nr:hypothetical protein PF009_g22241 [Phytophthora fragariae]